MYNFCINKYILIGYCVGFSQPAISQITLRAVFFFIQKIIGAPQLVDYVHIYSKSRERAFL